MGSSTKEWELWAEQEMPKGLTPRLPRGAAMEASPLDQQRPPESP